MRHKVDNRKMRQPKRKCSACGYLLRNMPQRLDLRGPHYAAGGAKTGLILRLYSVVAFAGLRLVVLISELDIDFVIRAIPLRIRRLICNRIL
jgi:hypothetical protein